MHIHPREWSVMRQESGDRACAANGSSGSTVFDGGVFPGARRGVRYRESFQGRVQGWKRGGMEWNGVERSARRAKR